MDFKQALNKAEALCSRKEYCKADIRKKLKKWEVEEVKHDQILDQLCADKFIDESRFASFFVRDKFKFNHWGKIKITYHLKQKGLDNETIQNAIAQIDNDTYREKLEEVVREKLKEVKNRDFMKKKAALIRNATSKGFEYQEVMPVVDQLLH